MKSRTTRIRIQIKIEIRIETNRIQNVQECIGRTRSQEFSKSLSLQNNFWKRAMLSHGFQKLDWHEEAKKLEKRHRF